MIKAALLDFDGTLVTHDILTLLCGVAGKQEESEELDRQFHEGVLRGTSGLVKRINLLKGLSTDTIYQFLDQNNYLMPGAKELFDCLRRNNIVSIVNSGNIILVLEYYQKLLGIDYLVGALCDVTDNIIIGVPEHFPPQPGFKLVGVKNKLDELGIRPDQTLAIGDSPADIPIFQFAGAAIAINPKNNTADYAQHVITDDLSRAIAIIEELVN